MKNNPGNPNGSPKAYIGGSQTSNEIIWPKTLTVFKQQWYS